MLAVLPKPFSRQVDAMEHNMGKAQQPEDYEWHNVHGYPPHLSSPAQEYGAYGFVVPGHEIQQDHAYGRGYSLHAQQPQPVFPATQWPSMLTNPSVQAHPPAPIQLQPPTPTQLHAPQMSAPPPLAPISTTAAAPPPPTSTKTSPTRDPPQRRTLTDQDRRRMCQYHEENPSVKQTEIGAMFGVERSTVSKVLRQKDKYLFIDEGSRSPLKKNKGGKFPDIERALSNWARNHERKGLSLSDKDIREQARFFATTVGSTDGFDKLNSSSWLEKFKQKNGLAGGKARKDSDATESDIGAGNGSESQTPNGISPISPSGLTSPSPISPSQSTEKLRVDAPGTAMANVGQNYNHVHAQSAASLTHGYGDTQGPPSSSFLSDVSSAESGFVDSQHPQMMLNHAGASSHRVRSQNYPVLAVDPSYGAAASNGVLAPKQAQEMMTHPAMGTPLDDYHDHNFAVSADIHHVSQPGSGVHTPSQTASPALMAPPPNPLSNSAAASAMSSPAVPPSQGEARRALELVMQFFQHQPTGVVDAEEYIIMGKLMEKLKVHGMIGELPGGMHSIGVSHHEVNRKRSVNSLSM